MHWPAAGFFVAIVAGTYLPVVLWVVIGGQDSPGDVLHEDVYENIVM
jgi:hypothetical protein